MTWLTVQPEDGFKYRKRSKTVSRVLIERYLRDDIPCGSSLCDTCPANSGTLSSSATHYMMPDAASILDWMEVWELTEITGAVLLASVLAEVQATLSQRKAAKLRSLYKDRRRQCYLFDNVHHRETSVAPPRVPPQPPRPGKRAAQVAKDQGNAPQQGGHAAGEGGTRLGGGGGGWESQHSPVYACGCVAKLPRGLQAVLVAAAWFAQHITGRVPVVILSDTLADLVAAAGAGQGSACQGGGNHGGGGHGGAPSVPAGRFTLCDDEHNCVLRSLVSLSVDPHRPLQVCSSASYFPAFWGHLPHVTDLVDSLRQARVALDAASGGDRGVAGSVGKDFLYQQHLSVFACEVGVADGRLIQGVVHVSKGRFFVRPSHRDESSMRDILIPNAAAQNRSMHGDVVAVRLLDSELWQPAPTALMVAGEEGEGDAAGPALAPEADASSGDGSSSFAAMHAQASGQILASDTASRVDGTGGGSVVVVAAGGMEHERIPTGVVVGILQRNPGSIVACLCKSDEEAAVTMLEGRREAVLCVPFDRKMPKIRLRTRQVGRLVGHRFVLRVDGWDRDSQFPEAHLVQVLGPIGEPDVERSVVLLQHDIRTAPFSAG
eukprot:jgi/Mesvir1/9297/Mv04474-RA.1